MDDTPQQLVFAGEVLAGFSVDAVRQTLSRRAKLDPQRMATLFSGERIVIKRGISPAQAARWVQQFETMGARLHVEPMPASAPPSALPAHEAAASPRSPAKAGPDSQITSADTLPDLPGVRRVTSPRRLNLPKLQPSDAPLWGLSFKGRLGRARSLLGTLLAWAALVWLLWWAEDLPVPESVLLLRLGTAGVTLWSVRLVALRLHDLSASGWWSVVALIPGLGPVLGIALSLLPGSPYDNDHGAPPQDDGVAALTLAGAMACVCGVGLARLTSLPCTHATPACEAAAVSLLRNVMGATAR